MGETYRLQFDNISFTNPYFEVTWFLLKKKKTYLFLFCATHFGFLLLKLSLWINPSAAFLLKKAEKKTQHKKFFLKKKRHKEQGSSKSCNYRPFIILSYTSNKNEKHCPLLSINLYNHEANIKRVKEKAGTPALDFSISFVFFFLKKSAFLFAMFSSLREPPSPRYLF